MKFLLFLLLILCCVVVVVAAAVAAGIINFHNFALLIDVSVSLFL